MKLRLWFCLLSLIFFSAVQLAAQRPRKSASERQRILDQIRLSHNLLKNTNEKQDQSIVALATLNNQIHLQEELVKSYRKDIDLANLAIDSLSKRLCDIEDEVTRIRVEYAKLANVTYKKIDNENRLLYLLGSKSLGEAYARVSYFRQIGRYRNRQVVRLEDASEAILNQQAMLAQRIEERTELIGSEHDELKELQTSKEAHNSLYFSLKDKEDAYRNKLVNQRGKLRQLLAAAESRPKPKPAPKPVATQPKPSQSKPVPAPVAAPVTKPAAKPVRPASTPALTGKFAQNRGKLPWPVSKSKTIIAGKFGPSRDAFGNPVTNDGLFLQTPHNERVNAVYAGTVTGVTEVPLSGILVIVEHGNYRTAYAGLRNVSVTVGDKIEIGQQLGRVFTDGRTGETMLQFMVYRAPNRFENPSRWLVR